MLTLSMGAFTARLFPETAGLVASLDWRAPDGRLLPLLHAPAGAEPTTAASNRFGTWTMVPFANRAFGGRIDDGVTAFTVASDDPLGPMHGFGLRSAWIVLRADAAHALLEHRRMEGPDPYRYRATQEVRLDETGMTIALAVTNEADVPLPYGLGHHPWFPCAPDTRLRLRAEGALTFGEAFRANGSLAFGDGGPYAAAPVFPANRETAWSLLGWDGTARIETPSTGLAIRLSASETLRHPVVWAPAGADFLCVEPQSHAIGAPSEALVRKLTPLARLSPGDTLSGWLRIEPSLA